MTRRPVHFVSRLSTVNIKYRDITVGRSEVLVGLANIFILARAGVHDLNIGGEIYSAPISFLLQQPEKFRILDRRTLVSPELAKLVEGVVCDLTHIKLVIALIWE